MLRANARTLNHTAFEASERGKKNIQNDFTNRNQFTQKAAAYTPCKRANNIADLKSMAGIDKRAGYMERQEKGLPHIGTHGKDNKLMIPTTYARGGDNKRLVRKKLRYSAIAEAVAHGEPSRKRSPESNQVAQAYIAKKTDGFMRMNDTIFKVTDFQKNGENVVYKKTMVYNFEQSYTKTNPNPWLQPAAESAARQMQVFFNQAIDES